MAKSRKSKVTHTHAQHSKLTYARRFACDVLRATRKRKGYVREIFSAERYRAFDEALRSEKDAIQEFSFAEAICVGVTACLGTLDELIDRNLNSPRDIKPRLRDALRISAWEMLFSTREDYAVVHQGVELARHVAPRAAGLANAVLRKMARDAKNFPWGDPQADMAVLARSGGMPLWLTQRFVDAYGIDTTRRMLSALLLPPPIYSVYVPDIDCEKGGDACAADRRLHDLESAEGAARGEEGQDLQLELVLEAAACDAKGQDLQPEPAEEDDLELHSRPSFASDLAAQCVASLVPLDGSVLEIGSGRGTKTALMQVRSLRERGHGADIHALDVHAFKRDILEKRLQDLGLPPVKTYTGDGRRLDEVDGLPPAFDAVFLDAPCSGTGTFRRHPEGRWRLTEKDVKSLVSLQGELLASAAGRVACGGTLLYSTCSVLPEENEEVVRAFLNSEAGAAFTWWVPSDAHLHASGRHVMREGFFGTPPALCTLPVSGEADGHFAAVLVRKRSDGSFNPIPEPSYAVDDSWIVCEF